MCSQLLNQHGIKFALRYLYDEKDSNNVVSAAWNTVPKFSETKIKKHKCSSSKDAKLSGFDLNPGKQERKMKKRRK